jgi:hypothetical protein
MDGWTGLTKYVAKGQAKLKESVGAAIEVTGWPFASQSHR